MAKRAVRLALLAALLAALAAPGATAERQTIGYIENVRIHPGGIAFRAKIDTGALTSSLHVSDLVEFQRDSKSWLRFTVANKAGTAHTIELPVARIANVKRAGTAIQERYVVKLGICLGRVFVETDVNLSDREGMNYQMLIGRRVLGDRFLIDVSKKDLTAPECPQEPKTVVPKK